jgi:lysophospholipase L1-like esterase
LAIGLLVAALTAVPSAAATPPQYLAVGDSVPVWNGNHSYPNLIRAHYRGELSGLRLTNLAESGATSTSMLRGGQYTRALRFLRARRGHVALITIDIGGNDILVCVGPGGAAGPDSPCATRTRATIRHNIRRMLRGFARVAPGVPVIGMTYYDPYLGHWLAGGTYRELALSTLPGLRALNADLTSVYGGVATTADVEGAFQVYDFDTMTNSLWGRVPVAVERACSLLNITCHEGAPEDFGDDPNLRGARVIAQEFEKKIDLLCLRRHRAFRRC